MYPQRLTLILLLSFFWVISSSAQLLRSSKHFDGDLPNIETKPNYGFVFPVNADVLNENNYTPSFSNRYFMSLFGPRYLSTSSSSIGYYDFHQGADVTHTVSWDNVNYDPNNKYHIVCNCNGVISEIIDSTDVYLETLGTGRSVKVKCDSTFRNPSTWGNIYINYRHLDDLHTLADSAKKVAAETVRIAKGDTVGIVGASGITSTVHLHTSIQRYETGTNTTNFKNVHPNRIYPPDTIQHLHKILENARFRLLESWADSALFRIYIPYNELSVKRLEVINNSYSNIFDFEDVSDSTNRDNHALISGFEVFAYSFNRGSTALSRYNSTKGSMPGAYPASPNRDTVNSYFFPITADSTVYIMDVKLTNLPNSFDTLDFVLKLSDVYGNVSMGDYGTVWNGSTWSSGAPSASINAVIASSTTPGAFTCRNLTIEKGFTLNLGANNLTISGNLSNYGNGISGTGTITFNKSGTAIMFEDTVSYGGVIEVASGTTLSTNGLLTITASSANSYGQLLGDGSVSGNVNVQAYLAGIDGNTARYFHLGSPVTNAKLSDFNEGQTMVANSGSTGTVWEWNASTSSWDAPASIENVAQNGTGYIIYAGTNAHGTFLRSGAGVIQVSGTVPMSDVNCSLNYHNGQGVGQTFVGGSTEANTEGWNFVANPFPAVYDWDGHTIPSDLSTAIYVFDGSNYGSYTKGVGSASRYIAPFQGFFVQLTENTPGNMIFHAANRVSNQNPSLNKTSSYVVDGVDLIVESLSTQTKDQLFIGFDTQASPIFDLEYDAHKLLNQNEVPNLFTKMGDDDYSICRVSPYDNIQSFPVFLNHKQNGDTLRFTAKLDRLNSFGTGKIEDKKTGLIHDLGKSDLLRVHDTSFALNRYVLHFSQNHSVNIQNFESETLWYTYSSPEGINVELQNTSDRVSISIYDLRGGLVHQLSGTQGSFHFPICQKGVYLIQLKRGNYRSVKKVVY